MSFSIAGDGGGSPRCAVRRRYLLGIEPLGDSPRARSSGIFREYPVHDLSLIGIDAAQAAHQVAILVEPIRLLVSVGEPRWCAALGDGSTLAPLDLRAEFLTKMGVHQPLERAVDFRDLSIGEGEKSRSAERDPLPDLEAVALMAGKSVGRFRKYPIDTPGLDRGKKSGKAGPVRFADADGAADRIIVKISTNCQPSRSIRARQTAI